MARSSRTRRAGRQTAQPLQPRRSCSVEHPRGPEEIRTPDLTRASRARPTYGDLQRWTRMTIDAGHSPFSDHGLSHPFPSISGGDVRYLFGAEQPSSKGVGVSGPRCRHLVSLTYSSIDPEESVALWVTQTRTLVHRSSSASTAILPTRRPRSRARRGRSA